MKEVALTPTITAIHGDCMDYLKDLQENAFELAIVDPPYGINADNMQMGSAPNRSGKGQYPGESTAVKLKKGRLNSGSGKLKNRILNRSNCSWDYEKPSVEYFDLLFDRSIHQIIWGGNYFELPPTRGIAIWNKLQPWENFSQAELAWTSFDRPAKLLSLSNTGGANAEIKIHPTQKPVALYRWLLQNYANEGDRIIDTHGGSMSIAIACDMGGYELVVIEKDEGYFNSAIDRFQEYKKQHQLFSATHFQSEQKAMGF